jgi:hypothetical protein
MGWKGVAAIVGVVIIAALNLPWTSLIRLVKEETRSRKDVV